MMLNNATPDSTKINQDINFPDSTSIQHQSFSQLNEVSSSSGDHNGDIRLHFDNTIPQLSNHNNHTPDDFSGVTTEFELYKNMSKEILGPTGLSIASPIESPMSSPQILSPVLNPLDLSDANTQMSVIQQAADLNLEDHSLWNLVNSDVEDCEQENARKALKCHRMSDAATSYTCKDETMFLDSKDKCFEAELAASSMTTNSFMFNKFGSDVPGMSVFTFGISSASNTTCAADEMLNSPSKISEPTTTNSITSSRMTHAILDETTQQSIALATNPNGHHVITIEPEIQRVVKEPSLNLSNFSTRHGSWEAKVLVQPEEQHRARYQTEGSRGAVKDQSGNACPVFKLFGYNKPVNVQIFIGTDYGKVKPHGFYQACKVYGKNTTQCMERDIDGTTVIEVALEPTEDMTANIDCVGILKLRNADVEQRIGLARSKKKSTRARMIFRVNIPKADGGYQTLQVASSPISCTQPAGVPEISKMSMHQSPSEGGSELFIIGKNFLKGSKVMFQEKSDSDVVWSQEADIDAEYFHASHMIVTVPPYRTLEVTSPISVEVVVVCGARSSEVVNFAYTQPTPQSTQPAPTNPDEAGDETTPIDLESTSDKTQSSPSSTDSLSTMLLSDSNDRPTLIEITEITDIVNQTQQALPSVPPAGEHMHHSSRQQQEITPMETEPTLKNKCVAPEALALNKMYEEASRQNGGHTPSTMLVDMAAGYRAVSTPQAAAAVTHDVEMQNLPQQQQQSNAVSALNGAQTTSNMEESLHELHQLIDEHGTNSSPDSPPCKKADFGTVSLENMNSNNQPSFHPTSPVSGSDQFVNTSNNEQNLYHHHNQSHEQHSSSSSFTSPIQQQTNDGIITTPAFSSPTNETSIVNTFTNQLSPPQQQSTDNNHTNSFNSMASALAATQQGVMSNVDSYSKENQLHTLLSQMPSSNSEMPQQQTNSFSNNTTNDHNNLADNSTFCVSNGENKDKVAMITEQTGEGRTSREMYGNTNSYIPLSNDLSQVKQQSPFTVIPPCNAPVANSQPLLYNTPQMPPNVSIENIPQEAKQESNNLTTSNHVHSQDLQQQHNNAEQLNNGQDFQQAATALLQQQNFISQPQQQQQQQQSGFVLGNNNGGEIKPTVQTSANSQEAIFQQILNEVRNHGFKLQQRQQQQSQNVVQQNYVPPTIINVPKADDECKQEQPSTPPANSSSLQDMHKTMQELVSLLKTHVSTPKVESPEVKDEDNIVTATEGQTSQQLLMKETLQSLPFLAQQMHRVSVTETNKTGIDAGAAMIQQPQQQQNTGHPIMQLVNYATANNTSSVSTVSNNSGIVQQAQLASATAHPAQQIRVVPCNIGNLPQSLQGSKVQVIDDATWRLLLDQAQNKQAELTAAAQQQSQIQAKPQFVTSTTNQSVTILPFSGQPQFVTTQKPNQQLKLFSFNPSTVSTASVDNANGINGSNTSPVPATAQPVTLLPINQQQPGLKILPTAKVVTLNGGHPIIINGQNVTRPLTVVTDGNVSPTTAHKSFTSSNNGILSRSGLLGQLLTGGRPCMPGPSYLPPQQPAPTAATLGMPRHQPMDTSANSYWQQHTTTPSLFNQDDCSES